MDILELDERVEKDIHFFEKSLDEYETLIYEASELKVTFENQINELRGKYDKKVNSLIEKFDSDKKASLSHSEQISDCYQNSIELFKKISAKKDDLEAYVNNITETYEKKLSNMIQQNDENIIIFDKKINTKVEELEALNKRDFLERDNAIGDIVEKINKDIANGKVELEHNFNNISGDCLTKIGDLQSWVEKQNSTNEEKNDLNFKLITDEFDKKLKIDFDYFEQKNIKLIENLKIFMGLSSVLFITIIILLIRG